MPQENAVAGGGPLWTAADFEIVRYLWNQARDAAVYDLYFGIKADAVIRRNRQGEIIVAVTAPGSVISGWALWNFSIPAFSLAGWAVPDLALGHFLWIGLGALASVIAVLKPILRPDQMISEHTKRYSEFRAINRGYETLIRSIQRQGTTNSDDLNERYDKLEERRTNADQLRPPKVDESLRQRCKEQVLKDMPPDSLWAPRVPGLHPNVLASSP